MNYGKTLYALRVYRGWAGMTQDELAEVSGVSRSTISRLETGAQKALPSTTGKLADALGTWSANLADFETLRIAG